MCGLPPIFDMEINMLKIGCHLSSSKGYLAMVKDAVKIGANTFAFFTRNPRGIKAKAIDEQDVAQFLEFSKRQEISPIIAHSPYTLNPCSANQDLRELAKNTMADDLCRLEYTPYNFYPIRVIPPPRLFTATVPNSLHQSSVLFHTYAKAECWFLLECTSVFHSCL